jgi:phage tail sheath protein FI
MAEKIVSPGVFTRENDLSFLPTGISQIGAAVVGPTEKGPAFLPTLITTQAEYESIFGTPKDYYTGYAVQNYLRDAGAVTVVRVGGVGGYVATGSAAVKVSTFDGSTTRTKIVAVLTNTDRTETDAITVDYPAGTGDEFEVIAAGTTYTMDWKKTAADSIDDVLGTTPFFGKSAYTLMYFESSSLGFHGPASVINELALPAQTYNVDATFAATPYVKSQLYNGTDRYDLFRIETIGDGDTENTRFKVQISNIKTGVSGSYGSFSLVLRDFNDTDKRKTILEQYNNITLDPSSPNYIARRIGDIKTTIDAVGKITDEGDYANRSKYIRIKMSTTSYPVSVIPFGHDAYDLPVKFNGSDGNDFPVVVFTSASIGSSVYSSGFDFESANIRDNNLNYLRAIPGTTGNGVNYVFGLDGASAGINGSEFNLGLSTAVINDSALLAERNFCLAFQGGFNGLDPRITINKGADIVDGTNTQGFDCSTSTSNGSQAYAKALNAIQNADEYDINLLVTPGIIRQFNPYVSDKAIDICEAREDVFYIADFVGAEAEITDAVQQAATVDSNYVATYFPWVKTIDSATNKLVAVPPSVLLVGTFAQNDRLGAEWFAPAGLNRGGIAGAVQVLNRLTQSERDTLYEGKVNPIATFPGQGISAFGQKTLQDKASALDRINVRRLLINLKKFVASTSRFLVFEQNTAQTRSKFLNTVNPYLEAVQQRQGLYAFRVVMDETNNTPDVIDRNILQGSVFLQPAKTAEFIVIDFNILPTGASFSV